MTNPAATVEFIAKVFGPGTVNPVFVTSLPNEDAKGSEPGEKSVMTRDLSVIERHVTKWDRPNRALYFCVGTLKPDARPDPARPGSSPRNKENISEITALHADTDFKSIVETPEQILAALMALPMPPSIIVHSGRGYHSYWLLSEPTAAFADVELLLKQLADVVAGDQQVTHCAALMRLPGTHNTKEGGWRPVEVVHANYDLTYEIADLEDMLSFLSPILTRKDVPRAARPSVESNPFLAIAAKLGFKPPIDVEQRLSEMSYQGAGDSAIHATQLSVSASLLGRGVPLDEVVDTLIGATHAAAGASSANWNWPREARAIRRMCEDWLRKNPQPIARAAPKADREVTRSSRGDETLQEDAAPRAVGGGSVVSLESVRKTKAKARTVKDASDAVPVIVAEGVIASIREDEGDILLAEGEVWLYRDGLWSVISPSDEQWIRTLIQKGCDALGKAGDTKAANAAWKRLNEHPELHRRKVEWDGGGLLATGNGMVEIATRRFSAHDPELYCRRKVGVDFRDAAECPKFLSFLEGCFSERGPDDRQAIVGVIQELFGSMLATRTLAREQRKALFLFGPSRTGKTQLATIARRLIGEPVAAPSIMDVTKEFGLQALYGARAWIRDDAINEMDPLDPARFKTIVTGEPVDVNRKGKSYVTTSFEIPVILTTNAMPRARDASDAIYNRCIVIDMNNVVDEVQAEREKVRLGLSSSSVLADELVEIEGPGILNWALDGLDRLRQRGRYELPESIRNSIQRFKDANNPAAEWARIALAKSAHYKVTRSDLLCAYHGWQKEEQGDEARAMGSRGLLARIRTLFPTADTDVKIEGVRYVGGLKLTDEGLHLWDLNNRDCLRGGSAGSSHTKTDVNKGWSSTGKPREDENAPRF